MIYCVARMLLLFHLLLRKLKAYLTIIATNTSLLETVHTHKNFIAGDGTYTRMIYYTAGVRTDSCC